MKMQQSKNKTRNKPHKVRAYLVDENPCAICVIISFSAAFLVAANSAAIHVTIREQLKP
jgi:hypothetical protein